MLSALSSRRCLPRYVLVGVLGGSLLLTSCTSSSEAPVSPTPSAAATAPTTPSVPNASNSGASPATATPVASNPSASPAVKSSPASSAASSAPSVVPIPTTAEINMEGEPVTIALEPYQPEGVPIAMGLPEDSFAASVNPGLRWTEVRFVANAGGYTTESAYATIIWPKDPTSLQDALGMLLGDRGWVQQQGFNLIDITATESSPHQSVYPWQRQRWRFEKNTRNGDLIQGEVILGELNGQGFWAVSHLPVEFVEGYSPRAGIIFKTLQSR